MMFSRLAVAAALVAGVTAQSNNGLQIISPGGSDLWWVAQSVNVLTWTFETSPFSNFTILLGNQDPTKWQTTPIVSIEDNSQGSLLLRADQEPAPPNSGYFVLFANTLNSTDVYATSQPFEIKPAGSTYPTTTAVAPGPSTSSPSGSGSASSGGASPTGAAQKPSGAGKAVAGGLVTAGAAAAALGLLLA
ncbi:hypothetical protein BDW22DRAFT_1357583 [Trametopsis cervina]|nr:hypothetical protein BDW22DRAFT_1357583 [Trametopsis cervina]